MEEDRESVEPYHDLYLEETVTRQGQKSLQTLADENLDYLAILLGTRSDIEKPLKAHGESPPSSSQHSNTDLHNQNSSARIQQLVSLKKSVYYLLQENKACIDSLEMAIQASKCAEHDLDVMEEFLKRAHSAEQEDEENIDILPLQAELVELPLFPEIRRIPLLASQASEIEHLRLLVGNFSWSNHEITKLKRSVLNQCLRLATLRLADSDDCPDDLLDVAAAKWSAEELSLLSLPLTDGQDEEIDWKDTSTQVGSTHTPEECRTRWLMVDRPGLRQEAWSKEESKQLKDIIDKELKDGIIHDWQTVAKKLNSGRLAIDCFSQCQQMDMIPLYASYSAQAWKKVPLSREEQDNLQHLSTIWDNPGIIAARLASCRPRDQVSISLIPSKRPIREIKWSGRADNALIVHVAKECRLKRSKMFENIDLLGPINFAKEYHRRPTGASATMIEKRWNHIKLEFKKDPSKYLAVPSTTN